MASAQSSGGGPRRVLLPASLCLVLVAVTAVFFPSVSSASLLPPRLTVAQEKLSFSLGEKGKVLECDLDVGDDPISYRWLKNHQWVTGALGYGYRGYKKLLLALHDIGPEHAGEYVCEAANEAGVHSQTISVSIENDNSEGTIENEDEQLHTSEILSNLAASLSDMLAEFECHCDVMFLLHSSSEAPAQTLAAQANFVHTIADTMISRFLRVGIFSYSDYVSTQLGFGKGINRCALRQALLKIQHERWATRMQPVLRDVFKRFKKTKSECKVLFLPIFGTAGTEGVDLTGARHLKKAGVKIIVFEVSDKAIEGAKEMASARGDGQPYHWRMPLQIWPTIVSYMKYMTEELTGCMEEHQDIPDKCVGVGSACTQSEQCAGVGNGCVKGSCQPLQCNIQPDIPGQLLDEEAGGSGCCSAPGGFWCGDVTANCTPSNTICDGVVDCMNGADEDRCWSKPCPDDKVARCQSSTLCLSLMDLCDGIPQCPGAEDEDPRFCRSFPCPMDRPFRCRGGKCIEKQDLCDGAFKDCEQGEDEDLNFCSRIHRCPSTHPFKCDYGICIAERMLCDGSFNCMDASDETLCSQKPCPAERPFKCPDGECISSMLVCNGLIDGCSDGADENNCIEFECPAERSFKCRNFRCIDRWLACDGRNDCGDNSDEDTNCESSSSAVFPPNTTCGVDEYLCNSGACISKDKICDGRKTCEGGEDERNCELIECPPDRPHRCTVSSACVAEFVPCDEIPHCPDGEDERNCTDDFEGMKKVYEEYPDVYSDEYDDDKFNYVDEGEYEDDNYDTVELHAVIPAVSTSASPSTSTEPVTTIPTTTLTQSTITTTTMGKSEEEEVKSEEEGTKLEDDYEETMHEEEERPQMNGNSNDKEKPEPPIQEEEPADEGTFLEEDVRSAASSEEGVSGCSCITSSFVLSLVIFLSLFTIFDR